MNGLIGFAPPRTGTAPCPFPTQGLGAHEAGPVRIRPIRPDDLDRAIDFGRRLSLRTRYQRFLSPRRPSLEEFRRFTAIDPAREGALVASVPEGGRERLVGVARFVDLPACGDSEFAIVLADDWQGRRLGLAMMEALIRAARCHGTRRLVGTTLAENAAMLALARKLGLQRSRDPSTAILVHLTLDLHAVSAH